MALHFGCVPTELSAEQVQDYLYELQQRSRTPSQTYSKHTVFGLRFLLKTEGLPYDFLKLPSIFHEKKLPVVLSRQEIWKMLKVANLLKHKLLIGLLYGCGLRCMEVRNLELKHLDFDRKMLHVVQSKGNKDRYVPLSVHLIRGIKKYKDYRQSGSKKEMTLSHREFTRRFAQHILPHHFVRIRHYGILSSSWKRGNLQSLQKTIACQSTRSKT